MLVFWHHAKGKDGSGMHLLTNGVDIERRSWYNVSSLNDTRHSIVSHFSNGPFEIKLKNVLA